MLIPDLLNILFDQSDFSTIVIISLLNKRKTNYANKYSLSQYYNGDRVRAMIAVMRRFRTQKFVCVNGQLKALKHMIECLDFDASYGLGLRLCAANGYSEMVKYLTGYSNVRYFTLSDCAKRGDLGMVKYLVSIGSCVDEGNRSALRESARNGHLDVVKWLVKCGADVGGIYPYHALTTAGKNGHLEIVKYLVENGVNGIIINGLFRESIAGSDLMMVKYLVSIGAHYDVDVYSFSSVENSAIAEYLASINFKTK